MSKLSSTDHIFDHEAVDLLAFKLPPSQMRPLALFKVPARQIRKHPEKQIVALAASYRQFGFVVPILTDRRNDIISGVGRVLAAQRAGLTEIPVIEITHLTETQIRAFRIADNKLGELSSFDEKELAIEIDAIISAGDVSVEAIGFETAEIDLLLDRADEPEVDPADEIPEPPVDPVTESGDLWLLGEHRLLCGSSLEAAAWAELMNGKRGSASFTDPPYNVPINGHVSGLGATRHTEFQHASGEMSEAEFIEFNITYLTHLADNLSDGAILFVCMDWKHLFEILTAAKKSKLDLVNLCVWNKTNGGMGSLYRSKHEMVLVLKKGRGKHTNNVKLGATGRYRCNVWDYAGANSFGSSRMDDLKDHPTVKPTALVADAIRDVSHSGEIVTDAFMGSGTTILAAERTRRIAYGIEIEPKYVDVAIRRWSTMTGKEAVLASTGETFSQVKARRGAEKLAEPIAASSPETPIIVARERRRVAA